MHVSYIQYKKPLTSSEMFICKKKPFVYTQTHLSKVAVLSPNFVIHGRI